MTESESDPTRMEPGDAGLSGTQLSTVVALDDGGFAKKSCLHCLEPVCVDACFVGALERTERGAVIYDESMCIGCRYCMLACPFHIPRYEWGATSPFVRKCDMCVDRQDRNEPPACVAACPHEVLKFGEREDLLAEAHARIADAPETYRDHVWGETEWGGTSLLYLAEGDLAALGWPRLERPDPISTLTDPLIHATPFIGFGVMLSTLGISAVIRRRMKLMGEGDEPTETPTEKPESPADEEATREEEGTDAP